MDYSALFQEIIQIMTNQNDNLTVLNESISVLSGQLAFITLILGILFGFIFIKFFFEVLSKWL